MRYDAENILCDDESIQHASDLRRRTSRYDVVRHIGIIGCRRSNLNLRCRWLARIQMQSFRRFHSSFHLYICHGSIWNLARLRYQSFGTPTRYIVGIYHVYTMYIPRGGIYLVYPRYIQWISKFLFWAIECCKPKQ
jgi:hypothetical protein